jgi:hypothetical protein
MPLLELICPAGSLPALKAAVDNGADGVYLGLKDNTNARNFSGLNFDEKSLKEGIRYAQGQGPQGAHGAEYLPAARHPAALAQGGGHRRQNSASTPSSWPIPA